MDTITILDKTIIKVKKKYIKEINNGKALLTTNRWYDIVCDKCKEDYEQPTDDYIVCNVCNRITYLDDLAP